MHSHTFGNIILLSIILTSFVFILLFMERLIKVDKRKELFDGKEQQKNPSDDNNSEPLPIEYEQTDIRFLNDIFSTKPWEIYTEKGFGDYEWKPDQCKTVRVLTSMFPSISYKFSSSPSPSPSPSPYPSPSPSSSPSTQRPSGTIPRAKISTNQKKALDFHSITSIQDKTLQYNNFPTCFDLRFQPPKNWNSDNGRPYRGIICPPLDQKDCGSCWAFSIASALTDRLRMASPWLAISSITYEDLDGSKRTLRSQLSPYVLAGCNWCGPEVGSEVAESIMKQKQCNLKCDGGIVEFGYSYVHRNGLITIACNTSKYRYTCHTFSNISQIILPSTESHHCGLLKFGSATQVNLFENDDLVNATNNGTMQKLQWNELSIMNEIYTNGTVTASFGIMPEFYDFFQEHPNGVFDLEGDLMKLDGHAVCLIGWGVTESGVKYWLAKNSWGAQWGDQGCFRIKRGVNLCGIESDVWCALPNRDWIKYRESQIISDHNDFIEKYKTKGKEESKFIPHETILNEP